MYGSWIRIWDGATSQLIYYWSRTKNGLYANDNNVNESILNQSIKSGSIEAKNGIKRIICILCNDYQGVFSTSISPTINWSNRKSAVVLRNEA